MVNITDAHVELDRRVRSAPWWSKQKWKCYDSKNFPNYMISDYGVLVSEAYEFIIIPQLGHYNNLLFKLHNETKTTTRTAARMVFRTFSNTHIKRNEVVVPINNNKADLRLSNLTVMPILYRRSRSFLGKMYEYDDGK